ncbi:protein ASPARTIC PROTEASE IN GUARD cell 1-like [Dorcoceras hygrometricum]|uniref:Protein ASPARTIC PROTEASE IN GUARD cell 1-like n=1 Tax=Dorcoceras hygrometricum TaxID=472368 RepID=A0A2Z7APZ5_9LAMI|nr:protein ASPARTIC PROTEASE IN GUARD cell 1-like [Dorcoceras hygrometricum]
MASSLISNNHHIDFDAVFGMEDTDLVQMFESLIATGLKNFMGCPAVFNEEALTEFFANSSVREDGLVGDWLFTVDGGRLRLIKSTTGSKVPSSACTRRSDEISKNGNSSKSWPEQIPARGDGGGDAGGSKSFGVDKAGEKAIGSKHSTEEHMSIDDLLMQISENMMLPSVTAADLTKVRLGESINIHEVQERDLYYASLPHISIHDKGKEKLEEDEPVRGNPARETMELICGDVDFLVQLRNKVMQDVVELFHSFSLNKLTDLDGLKALKAKEILMLNWAETDSLEMAVRRRVYILAKYREMLLRKFLESHRKYLVPGQPWTATASQIIDLLSASHSKSLEVLLIQQKDHGLPIEQPCTSTCLDTSIGSGAVLAQFFSQDKSKCWVRSMVLIDGVWTPIQGNDFLRSSCKLSLFVNRKKHPKSVVEEAFVPHFYLIEPVQYWGAAPYLIKTWGWARVCTEIIRYRREDVSLGRDGLFGDSHSTVIAHHCKYREVLLRKFLEARRTNLVPGLPTTAIDQRTLDLLSAAHQQAVRNLLRKMRAHGLKWTRPRPVSSKLFEEPNLERDLSPICLFFRPVQGMDSQRPLVKTWGWFKVCTDIIHYSMFGCLRPVGSSNICTDLVPVGPVFGDSSIPRRSVDNVSYRIQIVDSVLPDFSVHISPVVDITLAPTDSVLPSPHQSSSSASSMHFTDDILQGTETAVEQILEPSTAATATDINEQFAQLRTSISEISIKQLRTQNLRKEVKDLKADLSKEFDDKVAVILMTKKGEVSSSHGRGQPPPGDGGSGGSKSEPSRKRGSSGSRQKSWRYWLNE